MNEIAIKDTVINRLNSKLKRTLGYIPLRVVLIVPFISLTIITVNNFRFDTLQELFGKGE